MQALQGTISTAKDKRSLRDIQEEERARQQEADFLKWWAAEEERVRFEMLEQGQGQGQGQGQAIAGHVGQNKGGKARPRKPKVETQAERAPPNMATKQRESRGHRRPRQREDLDDQAQTSCDV